MGHFQKLLRRNHLEFSCAFGFFIAATVIILVVHGRTPCLAHGFLLLVSCHTEVFFMMCFGCCILLNSMVDHQGLTDILRVNGEDNEFQGEEMQKHIPLVLISIYTTFAAAQPSSISSSNQRACRMIL